MLLTSAHISIVRQAIARAKGRGDRRWSAGGLLAQIALLTGNTPEELDRWDKIANGDGPLTLERLQESGNAFSGWPVEALRALGRAWDAGEDRNALESLLQRYSEPHAEGDGVEAYHGQERRSAFTVAVDIKSILFVITVIAPLLGMTQWIMSVRQDVRSNTLNTISTNSRVDALERRMAEQEKARLIYCTGRRAAVASKERGDSVTIRFPDAGC